MVTRFYPTGRHSLSLPLDLLLPSSPQIYISCSQSTPFGFSQCMHVKRSVYFRMAHKKSSKGKGAAAEPTQEEGWNISALNLT